jgi:hypothetical protein
MASIDWQMNEEFEQTQGQIEVMVYLMVRVNTA